MNEKKKQDIAYGNGYEEKAVQYLKSLYGKAIKSIEILDYENHKEEQGQGKDIQIVMADGREIIYQAKSRLPGRQEFAFEVKHDGNRWVLKLPKANHYVFYIPDKDKKPYIIPADLLAAMFEQNYDSWTKAIWRNNEGDGHCMYVSVDELKASMKDVTNFHHMMKMKNYYRRINYVNYKARTIRQYVRGNRKWHRSSYSGL